MAMSRVSPFTRKLPRCNSMSLRMYKASTKRRKKSLRSIFCPFRMCMTFSFMATGAPIPYIQETEETTITSFLPDNKDDTADNLSLSISSLIAKSFSM